MRTKEQILLSMVEEMPFELNPNTKPYILEAMETYAKEVGYSKIQDEEIMKKANLISFMQHYKKEVPIGTQKSSIDIVNEYLNGK